MSVDDDGTAGPMTMYSKTKWLDHRGCEAMDHGGIIIRHGLKKINGGGGRRFFLTLSQQESMALMIFPKAVADIMEALLLRG
jgi:hypothetical protein